MLRRKSLKVIGNLGIYSRAAWTVIVPGIDLASSEAVTWNPDFVTTDRPSKQQAEATRLLARTRELERRTAALSLEVTPFDRATHGRLKRDLRAHRRDLADYRARYLKPV